MIPKHQTAFVFIWPDCLHALLLAAVGERESEGASEGERETRRKRRREKGRVNVMKWGGCRKARETRMESDGRKIND